MGDITKKLSPAAEATAGTREMALREVKEWIEKHKWHDPEAPYSFSEPDAPDQLVSRDPLVAKLDEMIANG